ncbi:MAG: glycosyltransferase [Deltaproteobacteria bacterium]|nr:glycosyltransferase [Deltaproteobacteria bacterium]
MQGEKLGLDSYRQVVGDRVVGELYRLADRLRGSSVQHVNSTRAGGGVAEILERLTPLTNELEIRAHWDVIEGEDEFWRVTKMFHNAIQGDEVDFTSADFDTYIKWNRLNSQKIDLFGDCVFIHDPQPAALIERRKPGTRQRFVWRCHIDASTPMPRAWRFLEQFVRRFDASIFSAPQFAQSQLRIPQFLIAPSIDPLSPKNRPLSADQVESVLERFHVDRRRPILLQVSRFDRFKDPIGVIRAYRMVKETNDCQLVLAGGSATDDPDGAAVLVEVQEEAVGDPDIHVLVLPPDAHFEINALQRGASIVLQKSLREGFGLTVSEALWKGKPVVGGATGGIPLQILDGVNGYLVYSPEGAAFRIRYLLNHPEVASEMGRRGVEMVRQNFLLTRNLREYLMVIHAAQEPRRGIIEL